MDQKIQQELLDKTSAFMQQASHVLGQSAAHIYEVLVRQQVIDGIGGIMSAVLFITLTVIPSMWVIRKSWSWHKKDEYSEGAIVCLILFPILITIVAAIISGVLQSGVEHILNPEYYAIEFIFNTATGKGN